MTFRRATEAQVDRACEALPDNLMCCDDGEVFTVLDAIDNGESPQDALAEWRFWRSPRGREIELADAFDSGRF